METLEIKKNMSIDIYGSILKKIKKNKKDLNQNHCEKLYENDKFFYIVLSLDYSKLYFTKKEIKNITNFLEIYGENKQALAYFKNL